MRILLDHAHPCEESFVAAVRSGLRIAAGTDAGTPYNPHTDLVRELELESRIDHINTQR